MLRVNRSIFIVMIALVAIAGCSGLAGEPEIVATIPPSMFEAQPEADVPVSAPDVILSIELGAQIYADNCTSCHGATGAGDGELVDSGQVVMEADFTSPASNDEVTPFHYYDVITNGRLEVLMPPWSGSLNEMERWSVAMYLYTLPYADEQLTQGELVFATECAECHGPNGGGTADGVALAGFHELTDNDLLAQVVTGGENMPSFADTLSVEEQSAVVAYVRTLSVDNGALSQPSMVEGSDSVDAANAASAMNPAPLLTGDISGSIVHGTEGGVLPDGMIARLHLFGGQFGEVAIESPVAADFTYSFEDIPVDAGHQVRVSVEYNDGIYVSQVISGSQISDSLDLPVKVYDLTYDPGVIRLASMVSQVFTDGQTLQVFEIIEVWNDSDRIYMGTDANDDGPEANQTIAFTLPENAEFVDFSGTGRYIVSADGRTVTDSLPVLPDEPHVVHMAYVLPYAENVTINHQLDYPLQGRLEVHTDAAALAVESDTLAAIGSYQASSNTVLNAYGTAVDLPMGSQFSYDVIGNATAVVSNSASSGNDDILPFVLLGLGVAMVVGSGGFLILDNRKRKRASADVVPTQDELIRQIAALDMAYQAGEVEEAAYRAKRKQLKEQVAAMIKADIK